jgi:hypothetical protein
VHERSDRVEELPEEPAEEAAAGVVAGEDIDDRRDDSRRNIACARHNVASH